MREMDSQFWPILEPVTEMIQVKLRQLRKNELINNTFFFKKNEGKIVAHTLRRSFRNS